jgi:hypothetical protein
VTKSEKERYMPTVHSFVIKFVGASTKVYYDIFAHISINDVHIELHTLPTFDIKATLNVTLYPHFFLFFVFFFLFFLM